MNDEKITCPACGGKGWIEQPSNLPPKLGVPPVVHVMCDRCEGTGKVWVRK